MHSLTSGQGSVVGPCERSFQPHERRISRLAEQFSSVEFVGKEDDICIHTRQNMDKIM